MTPSPSVLRALSAAAAVAVLAFSAGVSAVVPANAETSEPSPTCGLICLPVPSEPDPEVPRNPSPKPTGQEPSAPVKPPTPAPAPPGPPQPPAPDPEPVPTLAPEPGEAAREETPSGGATTSAPGTALSTAGPSTESNWNKPVTKSANPTQAAALAKGDGPGFGDPGLLPIMAGVLLVGLGGLAFAWYGRNRLSTH